MPAVMLGLTPLLAAGFRGARIALVLAVRHTILRLDARRRLSNAGTLTIGQQACGISGEGASASPGMQACSATEAKASCMGAMMSAE